MKKTILILLSLAVLTAFVGCSNSAGSSGSSGNSSSGGSDLSGVTDTSASWTRESGWFERSRSGNNTTYSNFTTGDKSGESGWYEATKWTLSNPGFTKISKIIGYKENAIDTLEGEMPVNYTLPSTEQAMPANNSIYAWKYFSNAYIEIPNRHHTTRQNTDNNRIVFIFNDNTKLELYWSNIH